MQSRDRGRIINVASAHGLVASIHKSAYVAAKHGIIGLTKVVALENAERGITCNATCPGFVLTPLVQKQIDARAEQSHLSNDQAAAEFLNEKQPTHRFTSIRDIAALTLVLCSPAAPTSPVPRSPSTEDGRLSKPTRTFFCAVAWPTIPCVLKTRKPIKLGPVRSKRETHAS
jgi:NAD(P)-dependent dehydrogenase (short-subunit alcohol dehydrogenase family)